MKAEEDGDKARLEAKFNLEQSPREAVEPVNELVQARLQHLRQMKIERYVADTPKHRLSALRLPSSLKSPSDFARSAAPELFVQRDEQTINALDRFALHQQFHARRRALLDRKLGQTGSKVLRGKLGVDTFFLAFGVAGALLIPLYFGYTFAQRQQRLQRLELPGGGLPAAGEDALEERSRDLAFFDSEGFKRAVTAREKVRQQTRALRAEMDDLHEPDEEDSL